MKKGEKRKIHIPSVGEQSVVNNVEYFVDEYKKYILQYVEVGTASILTDSNP